MRGYVHRSLALRSPASTQRVLAARVQSGTAVISLPGTHEPVLSTEGARQGGYICDDDPPSLRNVVYCPPVGLST